MTEKKCVYAVGIGPGNYENLTVGAVEILNTVDCIAGYTLYVDLLKPFFPDKNFLSTGMRREEERCRLSLEKALSGESVAMVCSGDAGVYGMAGLLLNLVKEYNGVKVQVIPGVTAATSGASIVGSPLTNDFCTVSLSDALTPWEVIEKRLVHAAEGDFVIALYNPASHRRSDYLKRACTILLEILSPETKCAIVRNIGRAGQSYELCELDELGNKPCDMFCTVFIGNKSTIISDNTLITPRGYPNEQK